MNTKPALSFLEKERICEHTFMLNGPYWHLCTDGNDVPILFHDSNDMKVMMNLIGTCAKTISGIKILTFEVMNNHIHIILSGEEDRCRKFFELLKSRLKQGCSIFVFLLLKISPRYISNSSSCSAFSNN